MSERRSVLKVGLYFDLADDVGRESFLEASRKVAQENRKTLSEQVDQRLANRLTDLPSFPHNTFIPTKPQDYAYELRSADSASLPALQNAIKVMADEAARHGWANASVFVGREVTMTEGDGPVFAINPLRRVSTMNHGQFMDYWHGPHGDLGMAVTGMRYRQNHIDEAATAALAEAMGLTFDPMDGICETFYDNRDKAIANFTSEALAIGALDDEKVFVDHSRTQFGLYQLFWQTSSH